MTLLKRIYDVLKFQRYLKTTKEHSCWKYDYELYLYEDFTCGCYWLYINESEDLYRLFYKGQLISKNKKKIIEYSDIIKQRMGLK